MKVSAVEAWKGQWKKFKLVEEKINFNQKLFQDEAKVSVGDIQVKIFLNKCYWKEASLNSIERETFSFIPLAILSIP